MTRFELINPTIIGDLNTSVTTNTPNNAVKKIWQKVSHHIMGNVPNLYVTLKESGTKKLHHYKIQEKVDGNKNANIEYNKLNLKLTTKDKNIFLDKLNKLTVQSGSGKDRKRHKDDSSSESDSDDEFYKFMKFRQNTPVSTYWYTPYIYSSLGSLKIYTPVWNYPILPYNEIWIPSLL
jgi:hypothetical protein